MRPLHGDFVMPVCGESPLRRLAPLGAPFPRCILPRVRPAHPRLQSGSTALRPLASGAFCRRGGRCLSHGVQCMWRGLCGRFIAWQGCSGLCRCALYGKPLKRTLTVVRLLALEMRREGTSPSIHPMDFDFHPMDRPFHPMEISIDGHFLGENSLRFAPYSGKKGPRRGVCGRAFDVCTSLSGGSDFRLNASDGAVGRKYSILRVKKQRRSGQKGRWGGVVPQAPKKR